MHYNKRKRMYEAMTKMVELGKTPEEIKQLFEINPPKKQRDHTSTGLLVGGIIIVGIAAGLALMAVVLTKMTMLAPAGFLLCLAFAMIVAYYIVRMRQQKNGNTKLE